jgi:hypothetical protein
VIIQVSIIARIEAMRGGEEGRRREFAETLSLRKA